MNKTQKEILNCIFDLIAGNTNFYQKEKAHKIIKRYIAKKNIEIDTTEGRKPTIKLGKRFILTLTNK